jgi:hypothetical protein
MEEYRFPSVPLHENDKQKYCQIDYFKIYSGDMGILRSALNFGSSSSVPDFLQCRCITIT